MDRMSDVERAALQSAMDEPMTDDEAIGLIAEMVQMIVALLKAAPPSADGEFAPKAIRCANVISYVGEAFKDRDNYHRRLLDKMEEIAALRPAGPVDAESTTPPAANDGAVEAPSYGIIDPDYARIYSIARCLAWSEGYALTLHGSFTRDLDLVAIPWTDTACEAEHLAHRIEEAAGLVSKVSNPGEKPHGRRVWTLHLPGFGEPRWVDLSIIPHSATAQQAVVSEDMVDWAMAAYYGEGVDRDDPVRQDMRAALQAALRGSEAA
ncbi:MAG TPA: hypothetical protein VM619_14605 [Luteimonas sp.]|nr:hypothetical protein [Luteimonas sp.]